MLSLSPSSSSSSSSLHLQDKQNEDSPCWDMVFDLMVLGRKLRDQGTKVILYIKQEDRPLVISSHDGEEDLVDTLTELMRRYMKEKNKTV